MAIVKPIKIRRGNLAGLREIIDYVKNSKKTNDGALVYMSGGMLGDEFKQMVVTKELFGKTTGRQYSHFVQSFDERDDITPELAYKIGIEYINSLENWRDFQIVMAVHTDQDNMHIHYVLNSVNSKNGAKFQCSPKDLKHLRERSDELCRKYNLHVIECGQHGHRSYGEYTALQKGTSWKAALAADIRDCLEQSVSRTDFLHRLNDYGIDADFGEKSMLFTVSEGTYGLSKEMKCGDRKLLAYGDFSRSAIEQALSANSNIIAQVLDNPSVLMDAMYDVGQLLGVPHENLLDKYYAKTLTKLEGRALREWILKHKDRPFEANCTSGFVQSSAHQYEQGYEI